MLYLLIDGNELELDLDNAPQRCPTNE